MARYSRKYVEINAVKNDGNWETIQDFLNGLKPESVASATEVVASKPRVTRGANGVLNIHDNDGFTAQVQVGWYLTFDGSRFAPCRPEFFEASYDLIEEPSHE